MIRPSALRMVAAEAIGTAMLVACVIGSGIMAVSLSPTNVSLALLVNAMATASLLVVLVGLLGPISGAHLNPAVTLAQALNGKIGAVTAIQYVAAQALGGLTGAIIAHGMFNQPLLQLSTHVRSGFGQLLGEFVATFGLMLSISLAARLRPSMLPAVVGLFIGSAYWFTSSTSFANPAVTFARAFTDTFSGIRLEDVSAFIAVQLLGAYAGGIVGLWLGQDSGASEARTTLELATNDPRR